MPPDPDVRSLLDEVARRLWRAGASRAAATGLFVATPLVMLPAWNTAAERLVAALVAGSLVAGLLARRARRDATSRGAAAAVERRHPGLHNVLVTAEELIAHPGRATPRMRARVLDDAARAAREIAPAATVPLLRPYARLAAALTIAAAAAVLDPGRLLVRTPEGPGRGSHPARPSPDGVRLLVDVEPPAYTGRPRRQEEDPERLEVIEGTHLRLRVSAPRPGVTLRFGNEPLVTRGQAGALVADAVAAGSGYFAIEPGDGGSRRLVPLLVVPDRSPEVRIRAPGQDLVLPPSVTTVPVTATAEDDFGVEQLDIRYTKVTGSGEQFEFEEGTLPARVTRTSAREWRADAELPIATLKLGPGDSVVYRAVARDARGAERGTSTSDTFVVEMQGRGAVLLEGLELPPEQERYALSQQMVVLKIERLREREPTMSREALHEEAALIAAEQRAVRSNFIFLMGGHVEDEEEEAEHSHEIQEGRLENSARREISRAIHHMTAAEHGLTALSTAQALPPARAAVEALQRAFGRNRYILRSLAVQSRIDPSRRLTGPLGAASDWRREQPAAEEDSVARDVRALLAGILRLASTLQDGGEVPPASVSALAEQALAIGPGVTDWQRLSADMLAARDAVVAGDRDAARGRLHGALAPLLEAVRSTARPPASLDRGGSLERAWAEEVRR